jgi:hypothetical protein
MLGFDVPSEARRSKFHPLSQTKLQRKFGFDLPHLGRRFRFDIPDLCARIILMTGGKGSRIDCEMGIASICRWKWQRMDCDFVAGQLIECRFGQAGLETILRRH